MNEWKPINTAPKDGSPVWARGWDFGKKGTARHAGWVYWCDKSDLWRWSAGEANLATHVDEWMDIFNRGKP